MQQTDVTIWAGLRLGGPGGRAGAAGAGALGRHRIHLLLWPACSCRRHHVPAAFRLLQPPACCSPLPASLCAPPAGQLGKESVVTSPHGPADAAAALRRRAAPTTARSCCGGAPLRAGQTPLPPSPPAPTTARRGRGAGALGAGRLPPPPASAYGGEELRRRASARPASCLGPRS